MKRFFTTLTTLFIVVSCWAGDIDNSVVRSFDLNRFLGSWYEIARFDHWFERGMDQTKASYKLLSSGKIEVLNTGVKNGKPKESKGKIKTTDTPALLRVSFFGPFYSDYRVMFVDKNYQYALVGSSSDSYLWILSRKPKLTNEVKNLILKEAKRRGYDTSKLIWVKQN
ncbi:MAG: lipocalin family protein [Bacteroidaceae bacterium]|nr:lipocalin family protein [Bacteroidaceae bacterium]